jgi:hypothetical protein
MNIDPDLLDDGLSSFMGTETLVAHDLVLDGLYASSKGPASQRIHHIRGARYLVVDQTGGLARYRRSLPYPTALGPRYIRLSSSILRMRASL